MFTSPYHEKAIKSLLMVKLRILFLHSAYFIRLPDLYHIDNDIETCARAERENNALYVMLSTYYTRVFRRICAHVLT